MRDYPTGWPDPSEPDQTDPTLYLYMDGASWPAAHDDLPAGCLKVGPYSISRNLRGSLLPGAIRRASGFSVGTANAEVAQPVDNLVAPWLTGTERVVPNGTAELIASFDGPLGDTAFSLGTFQVDPVSGALSDPSLSIELVESVIRLRQREGIPPFIGGADGIETVDASWVVDMIARQCGFYATPPAPADAFLSVPLQGGLPAEQFENAFDRSWPTYVVGGSGQNPAGWGVGLGAIAPVAPFYFGYDVTDSAITEPFYMAFSFDGTATIEIEPVSGVIELRPGGVFAVDGVTQSYTPGLNADWPDRVEVEVSQTGGVTRARVRSDPAAAWSGYAVGVQILLQPTQQIRLACLAGSSLNGFTVYPTSGVPWPKSNASIHPLDRNLFAADFDEGTDGLTAIQQVVAGALGAQWFSGDGSLRVRPRSWLKGDTATVDVVEVKTKFADVVWSVDPNDTADRVQLSYTPPAIEVATGTPDAPVIWEADEVYSIAPRSEITTVITPTVGCFNIGIFNTLIVDFDAASNSHGAPWSGSLGFNAEMLPFGRISITLANPTAVPVFLMDSSGNPSFKISAGVVARFAPSATLSRGVEEFESITPLTVNLGRWCQTESEASEALDIIWAGTRTPNWRIKPVDVLPDLRRELGDVVQLQFTDVGLDVKAIITGLTQTDGGQQASFTILDPLVRDFDEAWDAAMAGATVADFDTFWDARMPGATLADFDVDPLATP